MSVCRKCHIKFGTFEILSPQKAFTAEELNLCENCYEKYISNHQNLVVEFVSEYSKIQFFSSHFQSIIKLYNENDLISTPIPPTSPQHFQSPTLEIHQSLLCYYYWFTHKKLYEFIFKNIMEDENKDLYPLLGNRIRGEIFSTDLPTKIAISYFKNFSPDDRMNDIYHVINLSTFSDFYYYERNYTDFTEIVSEKISHILSEAKIKIDLVNHFNVDKSNGEKMLLEMHNKYED